MTISLCLPSRGRPQQFAVMAQSALKTASRPGRIEIVVRLDLDDFTRHDYVGPHVGIVGNRDTLSRMWNECARVASGEILMHAGDDLLFRTPGWDRLVEAEFARWPDRLVLVHGDDGGDHPQEFATHGFVHRRWLETVGYLVPPYFDSDMNDVWLSEVADLIGRRVRVPIVTEHMHPLWGKGELDQTHRERMERHAQQRPDLLYERLQAERLADVGKLRAAMVTS